MVLTGHGSVSISFCSALVVSSATVKNAMGGTVSNGIEIENSTKLLPALLAHHICSVHTWLQVPCLRGESGRGEDLVKGSRTLLWDIEHLLHNDRLKGLTVWEGEVRWYMVYTSMERVKGIDLQYGAEVGRHQMKCPSIKQQAWGKAKNMHCLSSTSWSGRGALILEGNLGH